MDLHRRRSVLVRMTEAGERLETVRIVNDPDRLAAVMTRAGEAPEVVLEATYGWYWAADTLTELGASVHLAHPLGVKAFSYRRVKNDERDAADLADLLRMGRLPEAWIAPPATRELRQLVRHRAKLVALRSNVKCQVHAVLAGCGVPVTMSDLFGAAGQDLLARLPLPVACRARIDSAGRILACLDGEIDAFSSQLSTQLRGDPRYRVLQTIPGIGPVLAAVFLAEIADVTRFAGPEQLTSWAGLTPRHRESDLQVHRGRITQAGQPRSALGGDRGRATSRPAHPHRCRPPAGRPPPRPHHRRHRRRPRTAHPGLLRAARRTRPLPATGMTSRSRGRVRVVHCSDPLSARSPT